MEWNSNIYYYDDENNIYPTRYETLKSKKQCKFYFYDKEFSSKNWSKEPIESLQELYKRRAQQIRDNYEHVVICYSGGIDSTQVLESFYYNNIHIDEILVVGAFSQDSFKGSDENHNGDIYHNVFPTLNSMHLPKTKISIMDYTLFFNHPENFTLIQKYGSDYCKYIGMRTSFHNLFWYDLDKFLNHSKKTAYVMGKDKPIIKKDDIGWFASFQDISFFDYGARYNYNTGERINFYVDHNAFDLILKQHYVMKKKEEEYAYEGITDTTVLSYLDRTKLAVYDLKNPLKFQSKKSNSLFLSARDVFIKEKKNSDIYNIYVDGLREMVKITPSMKFLERKVFTSKKYYLD